MKSMTENEINRSISNVKATLAIEGLSMDRRAIVYGRKYLKGQLSSKKAIEKITKYIQRENRK